MAENRKVPLFWRNISARMGSTVPEIARPRMEPEFLTQFAASCVTIE